ncbi:MAG: hypothetical protein JWP69_1522 [Flaviaesturariibacter sp.]|nr:hypothetical protein [Flaviaesturariibacter sp.]
MRIFILILSLSISVLCFAQTNDKIKLFLDCNAYCDINYLKTEITLVDFTPDNKAADVHLLITEQSNGGGGSQYQLIFYGQNKFKTFPDTIRFNTLPNNTDFENRQLLSKYIQLGLAPFIAKTSAAQYAVITFKQAPQTTATTTTAPTKDPWDFWVFNLGSSGNFSGDGVYKGVEYGGNLSATRITNDLKVIFRFNGNKEKTTITYKDPAGVTPSYDEVYFNQRISLYHQIVKSINQHWSYGYDVSVNNSTFSNLKIQSILSPAIEYNFFPYKESNNKLLTLRYSVDVRRNSYIDTTIYKKTSETLLGQGADIALSFTQKWGGSSVGISYHNYFVKGTFYYNVGFNGSVNVRITGGLSFRTGLFAGLTRDQITLSGEGVKPADILTRRRQIASNYNYYTFFGINYRFGSKVNNFVNPRFEGNNNFFF